MTTSQIEEVFCSKLDTLADPDCPHCEGTGVLADNDAYGTERECICIVEYRKELHADDFQQD